MATLLTMTVLYLIYGAIVAGLLGMLGAFSPSKPHSGTRQSEIAITVILWPLFCLYLGLVMVYTLVGMVGATIDRVLR